MAANTNTRKNSLNSPEKPAPKTAALYIRVSTHGQEELSPDSQRRLLLEYAAAHNMTVPDGFIYQENGISGRKADKRPCFQQMIAAAKSPEHPFDVILVWKYSRFARNQEESIVYKSMLRNKCFVDVISISEPIMDGPFGSLIERIIEWMDEFYSIRLSGDVKRGMTEKAMRGASQSRPPLGYSIPYHNAVPEIVPEEADIVRLIFQKYVWGHMSLFSIAQYLNAMGFQTSQGNSFEKRALKYILSNSFYVGDVRWNRRNSQTNQLNAPKEWIIRKGSHPAIISRELFSMAQELLQKDEVIHPQNNRPAELAKHWLSGLLKCPECGRSLSSCIRKRKTMKDTCSFQCSGYLKGKCSHNSYISEEALVPAIFQALENALKCQNLSSIYKIKPPVPEGSGNGNKTAALADIKKRLNKLSFELKRSREAYLNGTNTKNEYDALKKRIDLEQEELMQELEKQKAENQNPESINFSLTPANIPDCISLPGILNSPLFTNMQKNTALKCVVKKIIFYKEQSRIDVFYNSFPQG